MKNKINYFEFVETFRFQLNSIHFLYNKILTPLIPNPISNRFIRRILQLNNLLTHLPQHTFKNNLFLDRLIMRQTEIKC
jgi:hypothetical protein